jgi:hypothetical protein
MHRREFLKSLAATTVFAFPRTVFGWRPDKTVESGWSPIEKTVHTQIEVDEFLLDSEVRWAAVWNLTLTESDVKRLAGGLNPSLIRPENLVELHPRIKAVYLPNQTGGEL